MSYENVQEWERAYINIENSYINIACQYADAR